MSTNQMVITTKLSKEIENQLQYLQSKRELLLGGISKVTTYGLFSDYDIKAVRDALDTVEELTQTLNRLEQSRKTRSKSKVVK